MIGRLIGIDHGIKRIGLAVSDGLGITARELTIIHRAADSEDFAKIQMIARREQAVGYVVGIPQNPNAPAGLHSQADEVRRWIARFQERAHLPIATVSEYLTTAEAHQLARQRKPPSQRPSRRFSRAGHPAILSRRLELRRRRLPPALDR